MTFFHRQFPFVHDEEAFLQLAEDLRNIGLIGELNTHGGPDELVNLSGGPITESSRTSMIMGPPVRRFRIEQPSRRDLPKGQLENGNPLEGELELFYSPPTVKILVEDWLEESNEEGTATSGWGYSATHFGINLASALRTLKDFQSELPPHLPSHLPVLPGCFAGALSYDLVSWTQPWQLRHPPKVGTTLAILWQVDRWIIHDKPSNTLHLLSLSKDSWSEEIGELLSSWVYKKSEIQPLRVNDSEVSSHSDLEHANIVRQVQKAITSGNLYQLNFGRRWMGNLSEHPWNTMRRLGKDNPAPFSSWLHCPDKNLALCSSSPELLLASKNGIVRTKPIKGTRPRSGDPLEETRLRNELLNCQKEMSEHRMLVDLERNDLAIFCRPASVEHILFQVEAYPQVQHLVSEVKGELSAQKDVWDALQATFPGGSITGCPKTVTCASIDFLEKHPRSFWTGSIGYVDPRNGKSAWNILIRTLEAHKEENNTIGELGWKAIVQAGGGLVIGSNPELEVDEAKWKAAALRKAAGWIRENDNENDLPSAEIAIHPQPLKQQLNSGFSKIGIVREWSDYLQQEKTTNEQVIENGNLCRNNVRVLFVDNLDSFAYNIIHACAGIGADVTRVCGLSTKPQQLEQIISTVMPTHIILGPGPGRPSNSQLTQHIAKLALNGELRASDAPFALNENTIPLLGICLGHQALGEADGMKLIESPLGAIHGQPVQIFHSGKGVFAQIPQPAIMARYNSLILVNDLQKTTNNVNARNLEITAWDETKSLPMALSHPSLPIHSVQFHPESCGSENGIQLLSNFLEKNVQSQIHIAHS
ncbi:MAG: C26 family cysteine hydrolase domain-containing family [Euryarchaeota archaeon]|nr:C26 family cysteine hydrolase domain-containing family [Euryarchaeota archaeon]